MSGTFSFTAAERSGIPVNKAKHVALLRGINLGGKNKLPMKRLASLFTDAGCLDVETYIQSGNVVFVAPSSVAKRLPRTIAAAIEEQFGYRVPVVIRSAAELADVVDHNPFLQRGVDPGTLHVAFLVDVPDAQRVAALDGRRSPGDSFEIRGRNIYLRLPNGVARTKLTNDYFDRTLRTTSMLRTWNTVQKLLEMTRVKDKPIRASH